MSKEIDKMNGLKSLMQDSTQAVKRFGRNVNIFAQIDGGDPIAFEAIYIQTCWDLLSTLMKFYNKLDLVLWAAEISSFSNSVDLRAYYSIRQNINDEKLWIAKEYLWFIPSLYPIDDGWVRKIYADFNQTNWKGPDVPLKIPSTALLWHSIGRDIKPERCDLGLLLIKKKNNQATTKTVVRATTQLSQILQWYYKEDTGLFAQLAFMQRQIKGLKQAEGYLKYLDGLNLKLENTIKSLGV